ncbi:MAG: trypsin-like peptidase domain-containing protein [Chloroflexi bacterium]|nr:trypsin-like peptidase domain-containing protein [Chloroflexota bacterium]
MQHAQRSCLPLAVVAALSLIVGGAGGAGAATLIAASWNRPTAGERPPVAQVNVTLRLNEESAVIQAAERVGPAVVTLQTSTRVSFYRSFEVSGFGSGVIFDQRGYVLTNKHVIEGARQIIAILSDGRRVEATLVGRDPLTDLAVLQLAPGDYPVAELGDSSDLKPGQLVIAIGSPLGSYQNSVTTGVVSALNRTIEADQTNSGEALHDLIQADAAINPGNSGGPLVNSLGQVIGINTVIASRAQNIGFAIAINSAKPVVQSVIETGRVVRPWLGIRYLPNNQQLAALQGLPVDYGVLVYSDTPRLPAVEPNSPAARAGLRAGDIILAINGQRLDARRSLADVMQKLRVGDQVTLTVLRDGREIPLTLTLVERPT